MPLFPHMRLHALTPGFALEFNWPVWLFLFAAFLFGFLLFAGLIPDARAPLILCATAATLLLIRYPEIALALLLKVGRYKGDPRLSALFPFDPTLAVCLLLAGVVLYPLLLRTPRVRLPPIFLLYIVLTSLMIASLSYTPDFAWGLEKAGRFLFIGGISIAAPFFIFESMQRLNRFLIAFVISALVMSLHALPGLSGADRLVAPSGLNTQLGAEAGEALLIMAFLILPGLTFVKRLLCYPLILFFLFTLIAAGARGTTIAVALCLPLVLLMHRGTRFDFFLLVALAIPLLAVAPIPEASVNYLATLLEPDRQAVLGFRYDLMSVGWKLLAENPVLGVGIGGYPARSPNAALFNYPHNVFLEAGAEMGIFAAALLITLVAVSLFASLRQAFDRSFPLQKLSRVVPVLMILGIVSLLNSGDINSHRDMWLYMSLPFVLRGLAFREGSAVVSEPIIASDSG